MKALKKNFVRKREVPCFILELKVHITKWVTDTEPSWTSTVSESQSKQVKNSILE